MSNLFKPDSFVKFEKKKFDIKINNSKQNEQLDKDYNLKKTKINNIGNNIGNTILKHQDYILDILLELRNFDEKNGTDLFKNISYNNLNSFILKNNF